MGDMKPELECGLCVLEWVYGRATAQNGNRDIPQLFRKILHLLSAEITGASNLGSLCNQAVSLIYEFVTPESDFWQELKGKTNAFVLGLLPAADDYIEKGETPRDRFERACFLASAGNVAPIGVPSGAFTFPDVLGIMEGKTALPAVSGDPFGAAQKARNVFYVTDNAGEIGFDSLLVKTLKKMGLRVTLVVKEPAFFEDATMEDAVFFGLDRVADEVVTVNKIFVQGKDETRANQAFRESDLLLVKGTGSYESLKDETFGKRAIYLLKIKCNPLARHTGTDKGGFVVRAA